jgi:hypothetical protein
MNRVSLRGIGWFVQRGGARMYWLVELIENISSTCGQDLVGMFNYFLGHPLFSIGGAAMAYLAAMRVMCR